MNQVQINIEPDNSIVPVGIDLEDSFILGWSQQGDDFMIEMEFSIWPESPFYSEPEADQYTCYKRGTLTFHQVQAIKGFSELENMEPSIDPDGSKDWGGIYGLRKHATGVTFSTEINDVEIETTGITINVS